MNEHDLVVVEANPGVSKLYINGVTPEPVEFDEDGRAVVQRDVGNALEEATKGKVFVAGSYFEEEFEVVDEDDVTEEQERDNADAD